MARQLTVETVMESLSKAYPTELPEKAAEAVENIVTDYTRKGPDETRIATRATIEDCRETGRNALAILLMMTMHICDTISDESKPPKLDAFFDKEAK